MVQADPLMKRNGLVEPFTAIRTARARRSSVLGLVVLATILL
jgi:hypothetical protein